jgi:hypothetical protein
MADCGGHLPYLSVPPLRESQLEPGSWNVFPESDRKIAGRNCRISGEEFHVGLPRFAALDKYAVSQSLERVLGWHALDLNEIRPFVAIPGFQKKMFGLAIIRKKEEPFAVRIKPANGIDVTEKRAEILESTAPRLTGELAENPIWLVEKEIGVFLWGQFF